jgi:hypothetical protein
MLKSRIPSSWNFDSLTIPGLYCWLMTADLDREYPQRPFLRRPTNGKLQWLERLQSSRGLTKTRDALRIGRCSPLVRPVT